VSAEFDNHFTKPQEIMSLRGVRFEKA